MKNGYALDLAGKILSLGNKAKELVECQDGIGMKAECDNDDRDTLLAGARVSRISGGQVR